MKNTSLLLEDQTQDLMHGSRLIYSHFHSHTVVREEEIKGLRTLHTVLLLGYYTTSNNLWQLPLLHLLYIFFSINLLKLYKTCFLEHTPISYVCVGILVLLCKGVLHLFMLHNI